MAIAQASSARRRATDGLIEVRKQSRSLASQSYSAQHAGLSLFSGRLEHYLDVIEIAEQLAREGRRRATIAYRGGMLERAAYLADCVEAVAAAFALDPMRDAADLRVVAKRHRLENRIDVRSLVGHKTSYQI